MAAEEIFGPNLGSLKGKTVQRGEKHVAFKPVHLPLSISAKYRSMILCIDLMFVNKIPFLITISRHVKCGTVEVMKNRKSETIVAGLKHVKQLYAKRGFKLVGCHAKTNLNQ